MKKLIKILICILLISIVIFICYQVFNKKMTKNSGLGNNTTSQDVVNYILDINSYETIVEVEVNSNKNTNKYEIKQQYIKPNISTQEVIKPENIEGIKIIKKENELKIENSKLNLSKIFNEYEYMADNDLDLNTFIENYNNDENSKFEEKDNQIVMKTKTQKFHKYLYIDKKQVKPTKMEIKDTNNNSKIYILYKEITLNNLDKENILAYENFDSINQV